MIRLSNIELTADAIQTISIELLAWVKTLTICYTLELDTFHGFCQIYSLPQGYAILAELTVSKINFTVNIFQLVFRTTIIWISWIWNFLLPAIYVQAGELSG